MFRKYNDSRPFMRNPKISPWAGLAFLALLAYGLASGAADKCSRYCNPKVSKPCASGCISQDKTCHHDWTTACAGERPASATLGFETPKHVDSDPRKSVATAPKIKAK